MTEDRGMTDIAAVMESLGRAAREAAARLARTTGETRNAALLAAARAIRERAAEIQAANEKDMAAVQKGEAAAPQGTPLKASEMPWPPAGSELAPPGPDG